MWAVVCAVLAGCAPGARPNILFLMADQMRWDVLTRNAAGGYSGAGTPHLDRLASEGANFAKAYSSTPSCTPARAALLTGMKAWRHGQIGHGEIAPEYRVEMVEVLARAGYAVHSVGKDHFGFNGTRPVRHGYETVDLFEGLSSTPDNYTAWFKTEYMGEDPSVGWPTLGWNSWRGAAYALDEYLHPTGWTQREAVKLLGRLLKEQAAAGADAKPWFVKVSWHRPHSPYSPPQRFLDTVDGKDVPRSRVAADGWDAKFGDNSPQSTCGPQAPDAWCGAMPEGALRTAQRCYYAEIRYVDEAVGAVLAAVDASRTLVLFTSDHGDMQGDHYHFRKTHPFEGSAHVPMLVRWPASMAGMGGVPRGQHRAELTELRDVAPTFFDAAGVGAVDGVDGVSVLCVLDPSRAACAGKPWRTVLDMEHSANYNVTTSWNALTDGEMKYIWNAYFDSQYLFNVTADPYELRDLAGLPPYAGEVVKWRAALAAQFEQERRGEKWVKDGRLVRRPESDVYSPHYPWPPYPWPPGTQAPPGVIQLA